MLGIPIDIPMNLVPTTIKKIDEIVAVFNKLRAFIKERFKRLSEQIQELSKYAPPSQIISVAPQERDPLGINCFGIKVWTETDDSLKDKLNADENFPIHMDKNLEHKKNCLLRREFKWDKNFLKRHKYKE